MASKPDYSFHEVCYLFPEMSDQQIDELAEDIKTNGQLVPIVIHQGQIIDGRHRYVACGRAGVDPIVREWDGQGSMVAYVIGLNRHRRHLTASQLAMVAAKAKPLFEAEAKARQKSGKKASDTLPSMEGKVGKGTSAAAAANSVGASESSVERADRVLKSGDDELVKAVESGDLSLRAAEKAVKEKKNPKPAEEVPKLDPNGVPIQPRQLAFESLEKFKELDSLIRKIEALAHELATKSGGERLRSNLQPKGTDGKVRYRSTDLENFKSTVKFERPFTVCPYCVFASKSKFTIKSDCGCCKGLGWATKQSFENAPGDHRDAVEALKP